jgi:uncharacterized membrane protein YpjA
MAYFPVSSLHNPSAVGYNGRSPLTTHRSFVCTLPAAYQGTAAMVRYLPRTMKQPALVRKVQHVVALPHLLVFILALDALGYFAGMTGWYGPVLRQADTPVWAWLFIPDCPLFGLLGGLALLMVVAQQTWSGARQQAVQKWLVVGGGVALLLALAYGMAWLPGDVETQRGMAALYGLLGVSLLLLGLSFVRRPNWLLCVVAVGQIKYGIWTITVWMLFWRNTTALYGAPLFTVEGILMTVAHVGLALQGLLLLTYFRPARVGALVALGWFALSDLVDYGPVAWGLGWHPNVPPILPLAFIRNSTILATWLLALALWVAAPRARRVQPGVIPAAHDLTRSTAAE